MGAFHPLSLESSGFHSFKSIILGGLTSDNGSQSDCGGEKTFKAEGKPPFTKFTSVNEDKPLAKTMANASIVIDA
ncbi:hypothetical protein KY290_001419 [Solanum tuberosum]|uniref:Uncharacterized protein n=1 Tax=Solanum tuberosum TaxID=4113 RepID=A0ABQ7WM32_SOLTU|nr:hypothetical protein KY290_001419 [Solanum tuberosum]